MFKMFKQSLEAVVSGSSELSLLEVSTRSRNVPRRASLTFREEH